MSTAIATPAPYTSPANVQLDLVGLCRQQQDLAAKLAEASKPFVSFVRDEADPRWVYRLERTQTGGEVKVQRGIRARQLRIAAGSLAALADSLVRVFDVTAAVRPVALVTQESTCGYAEARDGAERVEFNHPYSESFKRVVRLEELDAQDMDKSAREVTGACERGCVFTQKQLIDLLRRQIQAVIEPSDLIAKVRAVRFAASSSGEAKVTAGRESVSRSVQQEMVGLDAAEFPDVVTLTVPVYDAIRVETGAQKTGPITANIECTLDVLIDRQVFVLRPKAGQIEMARQAAAEQVAEMLRTLLADRKVTHVPVLLGERDDDDLITRP